MKKPFLLLAFIALISLSVSGQDYKTSIGLRAGLPYGLTAKHFLSKTNAVEGILASSFWGGFVITGLYENEHWTGWYPGLNWFWGGGAHIGFWDTNRNNPYYDETYGGNAVLGLDAIIGLEYTFDEIPLNLSIDFLPTVNIIGYAGWGGPYFAVSGRYVF